MRQYESPSVESLGTASTMIQTGPLSDENDGVLMEKIEGTLQTALEE